MVRIAKGSLFSQTTLNDEYSFAQVDCFNSINLDFAWKSLNSAYNYCSFKKTTVAVIDSGIDINYNDLKNSIFISYSDDYEDIVVARSTSPNGPFTGIALVKDGFYTDKTAVKGVQYYYKAFACRYVNGEFYYSGYSDILPMTFH